jgi:aryl sulfotransferase
VAPWFDARFFPVEDLVALLDAQRHRRSIKTHTPADGIPWFDDCRYLVVGRDGRDAFMSFVNHVEHLLPERMAALAASAAQEGIPVPERYPASDVHGFFSQWLAEGMLLHHIGTFWERRAQPNVCFVHYGDLTRDLEGEMRRVAEFLSIDIPETSWPSVVERCTFAAMKARPDEIGAFDLLFEGGADTFLYNGTNGRWCDVLTPDELASYDRRVAELLPADAAAWLAGGRAALTTG